MNRRKIENQQRKAFSFDCLHEKWRLRSAFEMMRNQTTTYQFYMCCEYIKPIALTNPGSTSHVQSSTHTPHELISAWSIFKLKWCRKAPKVDDTFRKRKMVMYVRRRVSLPLAVMPKTFEEIRAESTEVKQTFDMNNIND